MTERKSSRTKKKFASKLIHGAFENNWEHHEIASLLQLILQQLDVSEEESFALLEMCEICDPLILVHVADNFTCDHIIHLMMSGGTIQFLKHLEDAFEQGLFSLQDGDTREALLSLADSWNDENRTEYAIKLCEQSDTKKTCGLLLHSFTQHMTSPSEVVAFIQEIFSCDYFQDLSGSLDHDFLPRFPEDVQNHLIKLLENQNRRGRSGELVDSDEDEEGNLRGFIVDSDDDDDEEDDDDDDDDDDNDDNNNNNNNNYNSADRKSKNNISNNSTKKNKKRRRKQRCDSSSDSDGEIHSDIDDDDDDDDCGGDSMNNIYERTDSHCFSENCPNEYATGCPFNMCKVCCLSLQQQFGSDNDDDSNNHNNIKCTRHVLKASSSSLSVEEVDVDIDLIRSSNNNNNNNSSSSISNNNSNNISPVKLSRKCKSISSNSGNKKKSKLKKDELHATHMIDDDNDENTPSAIKNVMIVEKRSKRIKRRNILESDDDDDDDDDDDGGDAEEEE